MSIPIYKLVYEKFSPDGIWMPLCMDGFGKGFSREEATTLKEHMETRLMYRDVRIVNMTENVEVNKC